MRSDILADCKSWKAKHQWTEQVRRKQQRQKRKENDERQSMAKVWYGKQFMYGVHAYMKKSGGAIKVRINVQTAIKTWWMTFPSGSVLACPGHVCVEGVPLCWVNVIGHTRLEKQLTNLWRSSCGTNQHGMRSNHRGKGEGRGDWGLMAVFRIEGGEEGSAQFSAHSTAGTDESDLRQGSRA